MRNKQKIMDEVLKEMYGEFTRGKIGLIKTKEGATYDIKSIERAISLTISKTKAEVKKEIKGKIDELAKKVKIVEVNIGEYDKFISRKELKKEMDKI